MPFFRKSVRFRRIMFNRTGSYDSSNKVATLFIFIALAVALVLIAVPIRDYLRDIASDMAISDSEDRITAEVNKSIREKLTESSSDYDYFLDLQKDADGNVTAITTNMARVNALSADILHDIIESTNRGELDLKIPLGSILGSNILQGRGPKIPVKLVMLTSSSASFRNDFTAVSINQSRHQIILEVKSRIDILLPWEVRTSEVVSEILIAETVIVGKVPETYFGR